MCRSDRHADAADQTQGQAMTRPYGFHLLGDGDDWCAVGPDFIPAGFGDTKQEAVKARKPKPQARVA
jgi:hypothetical protein